ncbi:MAG TPA: sll0787 family AIR synthase-like protein [Marinagarivorans sp.]
MTAQPIKSHGATVMPLKPNTSCPDYGHAAQSELEDLCEQLRALPEIAAKKAIAVAATFSDQGLSLQERYGLPGDDAAAFKTATGYQLLAMEGMLPAFVRTDPRAAGWSSVMANVSDIAAMGGRASAIVNAYWHQNDEDSRELIHHIKRACDVFGVAFAGGHSNIAPNNTPALAVAIMGHANNLLSCHHVRPGQRLFMLTDLTGSWHGNLPYWGCVQGKSAEQIRQQWHIPAELADAHLCVAAKDISNGGLFGTLIMLLELTGCGAMVDLNAIKRPAGDLLRWLKAFQSFGFLLCVEPEKTCDIMRFFNHSHLTCVPIGEINNTGKIQLNSAGLMADFWDLKKQSLTQLGATHAVRHL